MSNVHTPATKLVSINVGGNLHNVASYARKFGLSDFFIQADNYGVALFRMPIDWPTDQYGPKPATQEEHVL